MEAGTATLLIQLDDGSGNGSIRSNRPVLDVRSCVPLIVSTQDVGTTGMPKQLLVFVCSTVPKKHARLVHARRPMKQRISKLASSYCSCCSEKRGHHKLRLLGACLPLVSLDPKGTAHKLACSNLCWCWYELHKSVAFDCERLLDENPHHHLLQCVIPHNRAHNPPCNSKRGPKSCLGFRTWYVAILRPTVYGRISDPEFLLVSALHSPFVRVIAAFLGALAGAFVQCQMPL